MKRLKESHKRQKGRRAHRPSSLVGWSPLPGRGRTRCPPRIAAIEHDKDLICCNAEKPL